MRYKMKMAQWLIYLYFGLVLYLIGMAAFMVIEGEIIGAVAVVPVIIMIITFFTHGYYVLEEDHIYMRNSFMFKRIKYEDIKEISRVSRWKKQNFAMSKDRISIKVRNKSSYFGGTDISPVNIEEVYHELIRRSRNLGKEVI